MSIKLDLHLHSQSHGKIFIDSEKLRSSLRQSGLDGAAVTNFFDISHAVFLKKKLNEYVIIVGQEIWTSDGHIIGLGLKKRIPDSLRSDETIEQIHEQGGIAVAAHPYMHLGVGKLIDSIQIDAVETYNALMGVALVPNYLAGLTAQKMNIPQTASTDTSNAEFIGYSYTEVLVDNSDFVLKGIREGRVRLYKRALPFPFVFVLKNILNFKNIEPCLMHAVPCFICGKSMVVRVFKKEVKCFDCGCVKWSRIACCNGHYLCMECSIKRGEKDEIVHQA